jgi:hypothetical protein
MKQDDFTEFHALLSECLSVFSGPPSAAISAVWFRTLSGYGLDTLKAAFTSHMRDPVNGRFEPKPAHIIDQIERAAKNDGRPGAEEAWAIAQAAGREDDTVVWTSECAQAWGLSRSVSALGDDVGARMAFKETYTRLVAEARARCEPASWEVSEGFDKAMRRVAIAQAVEAGRLPAGRYEAIGHTTEVLMLEMQGKQEGIPDDIRQRLAELRDIFAGRYFAESTEADEERERLAKLKRAQAQRVDEYIQTRGAE